MAFAWDAGAFYARYSSPTEFQYQQYGPTLNPVRLRPSGRLPPQGHQMQVFLTWQDSITRCRLRPLRMGANILKSLTFYRARNVVAHLATGAAGALTFIFLFLLG